MLGWSEQDLSRSWRALSQQSAGVEWRFIPLASFGVIKVEVGCRFPGGFEALVMYHPKTWMPAVRLPDGRGFDAAYLPEDEEATSVALALVRRSEGSQDIFTLMCVDLLRLLDANRGMPGRHLIDVFVGRVAEWQDFMSKRQRPLSSEVQVGLMGELEMLEMLAEGPLGPEAALAAWQGPLHAAQDFHLGVGAIEVKSTVADKAFLAKISTVEQLDAERQPLFLFAFRYSVDDGGRTLPEAVASLRARFASIGQQNGFDAMLTLVRYLDEHAPQYGRKLSRTSVRAFPVDDDFPRLRRNALPAAILSARYVIDLDLLDPDTVTPPTTVERALETLGMMPQDA